MHDATMPERPPVFIQAYSRGGGTLFATILNAHPELAISYEIYQDVLMDEQRRPYSITTLLRLLDQTRADDGAAWVRALPQGHWKSFVARARRANVDVRELLDNLKDFAAAGGNFDTLDGRLDFIDTLMRHHRDKTGRRFWGGKIAAVDLEELWRRHPHARFFIVVRDGRDVLASRVNVGAFQTSPEECAREWRDVLDQFAAFGQRHPGQCMEVCYETLVTQPEQTLRQVCEHIGVPYTPEMLDFHRKDMPLFKNPHGHLSARQIAKGLQPDSIGRWRRDLPMESVGIFEHLAGDLLRHHGYKLCGKATFRFSGAANGPAAENGKPPNGAGGYFPLDFYVDFLEYLRSRDEIVFITYEDLAWQEGDSHDRDYQKEWKAWRQRLRSGDLDPNKIYMLLQHDVDRLPQRSIDVLRQEQRLGIPSNVMVFHRRISRQHLQRTGELLYTEYELDHEFLRHLQDEHGFVIGYHCNAYERALFDPDEARKIFREDVRVLRQWSRIRYFSPHGGTRDPQGQSNSTLRPPEDLLDSVKWVHNGHSVRFDGQYSDGGLNNPRRDPEERDLRDFVRSLRKGKRYRILTHPQYYCRQCRHSPRMAGTRWYEEVLSLYASGGERSAWDQVELRG